MATKRPTEQNRREAPVIETTLDLLKWTLPHLDKFPRTHRYALGEKIETHLLEVLEDLIEAAYTRNKRPALERANLRLQKWRLLMRIACDLKFLTPKQLRYGIELGDNVGRQIGGWLKDTTKSSLG